MQRPILSTTLFCCLLFSLARCSEPQGNCSTSNCAGCCDSSGTCQPGFSSSECGISGLACVSCQAGDVCVVGGCVEGPASDAGASDAGTGDAGSFDGGTDAGSDAGADAGDDAGFDGGSDAGNDAGQGWAWCGGAPCDGCCVANQCVPPAAQSATQCGVYRSECRACPQGESCVEGQCLTPTNDSCLLVTPDEYDFRTIKQGCSPPTVTFTVYNVCEVRPVTLNSITLSGAATSSFALSGLPGPLPITLSAFESSTSFQLAFQPSAIGAAQAVININVVENALNATYVVPVSGVSANTAQVVDVFKVPTKSDVLLVVDSSCTGAMQSDIALGAQDFFAYAESSGIDFNVAATDSETAPDLRGRFLADAGHEAILTNASPALSNQFSLKVKPGTSGPAKDAAFWPALSALTPPRATRENAGFMRWDASLGIAAFSDAPEQSTGSLAFYLSAFKTLKGAMRPNLFSFSAVAGYTTTPPTGCQYDTGPDNGRYATAVSVFGGTRREYCTFAPSDMQGIGETAFGQRTTWFLLARPDLTAGNSIAVAIEGFPVSFTYDVASNSVRLPAGLAPLPGQTITVTYNTECL